MSGVTYQVSSASERDSAGAVGARWMAELVKVGLGILEVEAGRGRRLVVAEECGVG